LKVPVSKFEATLKVFKALKAKGVEIVVKGTPKSSH